MLQFTLHILRCRGGSTAAHFGRTRAALPATSCNRHLQYQYTNPVQRQNPFQHAIPVRFSRQTAGLTLLELLLVIAILGLLAGLAIPSGSPSIHDQLRSAARILTSDLDYARALAVANSSSYRVTFDIANNRYGLIHTGSNSSLDKLPRSPFSTVDATSDAYVVDLNQLPLLGASVRLVAVLSGSSAYQPVDYVEFGPLGETTNGKPVTIWLAAGAGSETRYIWLSINPTTGLVTVGQYTGTGPSVEVQPVGKLKAVGL
jgi:prepilin-type N-terminal cleavage/methylation domain-containing protein